MEKWQNPDTITLWILLTVLFLLLLLTFLFLLVRANYKRILKAKETENQIRMEYQKDLLNTSIKTQEKERQRIAADLHDELIGKLTVLNLSSGDTPKRKDQIDECIQSVRRISHDLSPPLLEYSPLSELIEEVIEPWESSYQMTCKMDIRQESEYNEEVKIQVIRIVQEVFKNIQKHAQASQIFFHLRQTARGTAIRVTDNGKGFEPKRQNKGLGQKNIETRIEFLNGKFQINSAINKGTSILFMFSSAPSK